MQSILCPGNNLLPLPLTDLCSTLEQIAKHGSKAFYEGKIAKSTIAALSKDRGIMTLDDLKNYQVISRKTVSSTYRGYKVYSTSSPSSGSIALSILRIIEKYNISDASTLALNVHRIDEAMRWSYSERGELGDPDYFEGMLEKEDEMLSGERIEYIHDRLSDNKTRDPAHYNTTASQTYFQPTNHGTSHIVTSDRSGLSITLTSTVNLLFGSHLMVPETGIIMNNEMDDFSTPGRQNAFGFPPSPFNFPAPNKRPLSSITPVHIEHGNGSLYISIGAAGGSRIPTATVLSIINLLDRNMTLKESLAEKRVHDQLYPATTFFEEGFDKMLVEEMRHRGHNVSWISGRVSAVQATRMLWNGTFEAAGEPRQFNSGGLSC